MPPRAIASTVSTAETWTPSRRLQAAAAAERERITRELTRVAARERDLEAELLAVHAARAELQHQLDVLEHFNADPVPDRPRLRAVGTEHPTPAGTVLRGARIREVAVRVLASTIGPETPVHYRDWFQLLTSRGFTPTGKDPLATFLTQIGRSPLVQRSTSSGMYLLDLAFPDRARTRLAQLSAQLSEGQELAADATVQDIAAARELRDRLTTEMHEIERQLEEAERSLGGEQE
jgi:hypothetical protein